MWRELLWCVAYFILCCFWTVGAMITMPFWLIGLVIMWVWERATAARRRKLAFQRQANEVRAGMHADYLKAKKQMHDVAGKSYRNLVL